MMTWQRHLRSFDELAELISRAREIVDAVREIVGDDRTIHEEWRTGRAGIRLAVHVKITKNPDGPEWVCILSDQNSSHWRIDSSRGGAGEGLGALRQAMDQQA